MDCMILFLFILVGYFCCAKAEDNACCYDKQLVGKKFKPDEALYNIYLSLARWPTNNIYYDIDPHMDPVIRNYVATAVDYFNTNTFTCVRWIPRLPDDDPSKAWVTFWQVRDNKKPTIHTRVGFNYREKETNKVIFVGLLFSQIVLQDVFFNGQTTEPDRSDKRGLEMTSHLLHEMMHVMGFQHEHQRGDRDCWVYVSEAAMKKEPNFRIPGFWKSYYSPKFPYDLKSIMHYETMKGKFYAHDNSPLGRKDGKLSALDLDKLNYVYCNTGKTGYCDVVDKCKEDLDYYSHNPSCFREGENYNVTPTTCTPCHVDYSYRQIGEL